MTRLVVTGTGTGVGKTIVAAAILALAQDSRAYVKPVQTGVPGDVPDVETVARLSAAPAYELARFAAPLSPEAAARHEGRLPVDVEDLVRSVRAIDADLVVVEGAGGLLVRYDKQGTTIADVATWLGAAAVVVTEAGLGTLNATALTIEAMRRRGVPLAGLVIGSWPGEPGLAERCNVRDLETIADEPLAGVLPANAGALPPERFREIAERSLGTRFGGRFQGVQ